MNIAERRFTLSLSKSVIILVLSHCVIDDFYFYVIESVVLHRSLLAVPNTFMSFSPSLAEETSGRHQAIPLPIPVPRFRSPHMIVITIPFKVRRGGERRSRRRAEVARAGGRTSPDPLFPRWQPPQEIDAADEKKRRNLISYLLSKTTSAAKRI